MVPGRVLASRNLPIIPRPVNASMLEQSYRECGFGVCRPHGRRLPDRSRRAMMSARMGPGIIIPVLIVAVVVPVGFAVGAAPFQGGRRCRRRRAADGAGRAPDEQRPAGARRRRRGASCTRSPTTGSDGVEHVLIGPAGVFAIVTSMDPMPAPAIDDPDPHAVAAAAIMRGALDDALRRCAMTSDRLSPCTGASTSGARAGQRRHVARRDRRRRSSDRDWADSAVARTRRPAAVARPRSTSRGRPS